MKSYRILIGTLIVAWFVFALSASALHVFTNDSGRLGLQVAIAAGAPLLLFAIWFGASAKFREFLLALNPRILSAAQSFRIVGFTFVLLEAKGILPGLFAFPAGYGDMAIGATATLVAWKLASPGHRLGFTLWQALGILDLSTAVTLGVIAPFIAPQGPTTTVMTVLPLSLIPTFLVPLFLIFHVICIAQARTWAAKGGVNSLKAAFAR